MSGASMRGAVLAAALSLLFACSPTAEPDRDRDAPLARPRGPVRPASPLRDQPFLQEVNELPAAAAQRPFVALLAGDRDAPIAVEPRRVNHASVPELSLPAGEAPLAWAAESAGRIVLSSTAAIWSLAPGGGWIRAALDGGEAIRGLAGGDRRIWVLGARRLWSWSDESEAPSIALETSASAAHESSGSLWIASGAEITRRSAARVTSEIELRLVLPDGAGEVRALTTGVTVPAPIDLAAAADGGLYAARGAGWVAVPELAPDRVPYRQPRRAIALPDGSLTIATPSGAMRLVDRGDGPEWRVYNPTRWVPSPDVRDVAFAGGALWFATDLGLSRARARQTTLEEKMRGFVDRVVLRHDRDGAVADSHLTTRGDLSTNIPWDSDNDASWTHYWVRSECYRYKVTGDPEAKAHFDKSLDRMLSLRDLTGTDHFFARAVIRKAGCMLDDCDAPDDGEWFTSPDGEWWVKGDTSNDELTAQVVMMDDVYDLCADEAQRERIRRHIGGIVGGIMERGWQLVDLDGQVTKYGQLDPHYVHETIPGQFGDGGLRAAQMLAALTLAHYLTGERRFLDGKRELIEQHGYATAAEREYAYPLRPQSEDNDEMSVSSWIILLRYENDPDLYQRWVATWSDHWRRRYQPQRGPWWSVVNAILGGEPPSAENLVRPLRLQPVDLIRWSMANRARADLVAPSDFFPRDRRRLRSDGRPVPADERPIERYNVSQFVVEGGFDGWIEHDGADVLAPYWAARFYGFLE